MNVTLAERVIFFELLAKGETVQGMIKAKDLGYECYWETRRNQSGVLNCCLVKHVARNKAYIADSADYLTKPFVSMYFGVAYFLWERSNQFIVQAYIKGPDHVDLETSSCPLWLTFEQALSSMKNRREAVHWLVKFKGSIFGSSFVVLNSGLGFEMGILLKGLDEEEQ
ncbi:hypothetical protein F2Q70_00017085 [Brassica cretica]|uniref:Uncharacterized protein n=1 Tax=Brassica cretica TaxID=69181 RepID=A0A8S9I3V3_BRACR|nr:hypothetical protein F2Q70_00017085 [Brassica cretica]